jgi:hypothetical protein
MPHALALSLLFGLAAATAYADSFHVYANPRFGATAEVPSDWKPDPPPENGDGLVFRSPDGAASLTVSGIYNLDETAKEAMDEEDKPRQGETITYHQRGPRFVAVSGVAGDKIFYRKSLLVCGDQIWNHLSMEYPAARKSEYDAIVARASKSLRFGGVSDEVAKCR